MSRKRSLSAWIRLVHRWISLVFVATAAVLILQTSFTGSSDGSLGLIALVLLLALALTGSWTAVEHYLVKLRHRRPKLRATP